MKKAQQKERTAREALKQERPRQAEKKQQSPNSVAGPTTDPLTARKSKDQWFNEGRTYHQAQQYQKAIDAYSRTIALDPSYVWAYYNRGNAYSDLKQYKEAIADYDRALKIDPSLDLAKTKREKASKTNAVAPQPTQIPSQPNLHLSSQDNPQPNTLKYCHWCHFMTPMQIKESKMAFTEATCTVCGKDVIITTQASSLPSSLSSSPDNSPSGILGQSLSSVQTARKSKDQWFNEGRTYHQAQQYQKAIDAYSRAIALDPSYVWAYYNRGNAYSDLKQYKEAVADYDRALALDPSLDLAKTKRAGVRHLLTRY